MQPCIIFMDEIDGLLRNRTTQDASCVYGMKTELLNQMDGIQTKSTDAIIVIGCTNTPQSLDPAVRRRLAKQFHVDLPSSLECVEIMEMHLRADDTIGIEREWLQKVCEKLAGKCSGSDLANIVRQASCLRMDTFYKSSAFSQILDDAKTAEDVLPSIRPIQKEHLQAVLEKMQLLPLNYLNQIDDEEEQGPP